MNERTRNRVRIFSLVSGGFAFALALTMIVFGPRSGFGWFLVIGTGISFFLNLRILPKVGGAAV